MAGTQKLGNLPSIPVPNRSVQAPQSETAPAAAPPPAVAEDQSQVGGHGIEAYAPKKELKLSDKQNDAFQALSAEDQASFMALHAELAQTPGAQANLCGLLNRPSVLESKDAKGDSLLGTLGQAVGNTGNLARLSATELVGGLLKQLANPASVYQGDTRTCAAASLQIYMAESDPAEYCRIARELWETGESTFRNGQEILREPSRPGDERNPLDALLQDAWTETGKDFEATNAEARGDGDWSVVEGLEALGSALMNLVPINSILSFLTGKKQAEGLTTNQIRQLYGCAMDSVPMVVDARTNPDRNFKKLEEILDSGLCTTVGLKTSRGDSHCVSVLAIKDGKVTFADPASGKTHQASTGEFKAMMSILVVPKEFTEGYSQQSIVNTLQDFGGVADPYGGRGGGGGTAR